MVLAVVSCKNGSNNNKNRLVELHQNKLSTVQMTLSAEWKGDLTTGRKPLQAIWYVVKIQNI